ncbi:hypothetical protein [Terrabacter sp. C0L_2]|uniref:hypothetical protein n=1 Tax=Terrabacter sp. C0L_2 TaxID=3108389 RepID=UPI002ED63014|nr:hypothetical protein U5C87_17875 [Terrabacter sp. C0L_2]
MPQIDLPGWSQFILALVAVAGAIGAHRLNKRGQVTQTAQQNAANELATRAQGFDEMEAVVEWQAKQIEKLEARADRESQAQARRCRSSLDHFMSAFITLIGQVGAEEAKRSAEKALTEAEVHLAEDHPEMPTP